MAKQTYTTGQVLTAAQMTALQANDYNWTVSAKTASYVLVAADAGTRITMSNAGATTITVNTALFTAGDTLTVTNIGAGACTITAGTATVSTAGSLVLNQYDSGTLYFSSTSAAIWNGANPGDITGVTAGTGISGGGTSGTVTVSIDTAVTVDKTTAQTLTNKTLTSPALTTPTISTATTNGDLLYGTGSGALTRLGIGSTSQVLTVAGGVPSWATPSSGGITQLATGSLTGASVSITSISGSYKNLVLYLQNASLVTAGEIRFTINSLTSPYGYSYASNGSLSTSGTSGVAFGYLGNFPAYQDSTSVTLTIPNYAMTSSRPHWQMFGGQYPSNGSPMAVFSWGALNNGVAVTSLQLFPGSGNFNSGTYYLYGVN